MKKITLDRLQNAEYIAMMNDILSLLNDSNISELTSLATRLTPLVETMDKGVVQIKKSEHTQTLSQLDKERDDYIKAIRYIVKAEHFAKESDNRQQAKTVQILLNVYKGLEKENFRKESELIGNLLADFLQEPYQSAVHALNLQRWLDALQGANDNFIAIYNKRRDEDANNQPINVKSTRQAIDKVYHELINLLNALMLLQPSDNLTKLIAKINQIIEKWQETIAIRQGINKKQQPNDNKIRPDKKPDPQPKPIEVPPIVNIDE